MCVCCVYMTDPRLAVSVTLFSPNTGCHQELRQLGDSLPLSVSLSSGSPGQGPPPFLQIAPPGDLPCNPC